MSPEVGKLTQVSHFDKQLFPDPTLHFLYATGKLGLRVCNYVMLLFLEEVSITCFLVAGESSFSYFVIFLLLEETLITYFPITGKSSSSYLR